MTENGNPYENPIVEVVNGKATFVDKKMAKLLLDSWL